MLRLLRSFFPLFAHIYQKMQSTCHSRLSILLELLTGHQLTVDFSVSIVKYLPDRHPVPPEAPRELLCKPLSLFSLSLQAAGACSRF